MCGIAGVWKFNGERLNRGELEKMANTLKHRGPDGEGFWIREDQRLGFAHRRLKIIDLSAQADQPFFSQDGKFVIVLNGEIYNYIELKRKLQQQGYSFSTTSDTEVLLYMYIVHGINCLNYLDGMFAFAIYDKDRDYLFCARDRFGEKPFFFSWYKDTFYFASEVKALFAAGVPSDINEKALYRYFVYNTVENPYVPDETLYQYVKQLPHSHYIVVENNASFRLKKYYEISIKKYEQHDVVERFLYYFDTSIERRLRSDVAVGTSLSGGLDSSSIVVKVAEKKQERQIQYSFSARFPGFTKDEGFYIEKVIQKTHLTPVYVYPNENSMYENLSKIFYHQEFPFGSTSIAAQYEVMKAARDHGVIVLLDGQGADETLAGYDFYRKTYLKELLRTKPWLYWHEKKMLKKNFNLNVQLSTKEWVHLFFPSFFDFMRRMGRKGPHISQSFNLSHSFHESFGDEPSPFQYFYDLNSHLYFSTFVLGLQDLLRYADRNAMAHGVEVRLPFLYHEWVDYIFSLSSSWKIKDGWSKFVLRKAMEPSLPQEITWRKEKIGYEPPQERIFADARFQDLFKEAAGFCQKQGYITQPLADQVWVYLMVYLLYDFANKWK